MSTDPLDYPFWLASRSAGVVAYLLLSALGRARARDDHAARVARARPARADRAARARRGRRPRAAPAARQLAAREPLRAADPVHAPATGRCGPGLGISPPTARPALSLTYYARRRLGARRWRNAHRFIPVAWALAAAHVIGAGTDAVSLWLQVVLAATIAAVVVLIVQRGLAGSIAARWEGTRAGRRRVRRNGAGSIGAGSRPAASPRAGAELGLFR